MRFELRFRWKSSSISPQTPLMRLLIIHHMGQKNKAKRLKRLALYATL